MKLLSFDNLDDDYRKKVITMDNNPLSRLDREHKLLNIYEFLLDENILKKSNRKKINIL